MSKIKEIYQKHWKQRWQGLIFKSNTDQQDYIFQAMKEYSEFYAHQCLEIAESHLENEDNGFQRVWPLSIKLPPHE